MRTGTPRSAVDVLGLEYDWLGCDESGCVVLFSTAGSGYAPGAFLDDTDAHDRAIEAILALPESTEAKFFPDLAPGFVNTWRLVAERGLYAYDADPNGGPYRVVASPANPARIETFSAIVGDAAVPLGRLLRFQFLGVISAEMLQASEVP